MLKKLIILICIAGFWVPSIASTSHEIGLKKSTALSPSTHVLHQARAFDTLQAVNSLPTPMPAILQPKRQEATCIVVIVFGVMVQIGDTCISGGGSSGGGLGGGGGGAF
jgi:hypothetical protein